MNIIGALKKSGSSSAIYFCEYSEEIEWSSVVALLQACNLMQDLNAEDIYCVAIESRDNLAEDKALVGITFRNGQDYVSLVPQNYEDLDFYLNELNNNEGD